MRNKGLDRRTWSAFWLAVLENSVDFLSIFFVYELDSYIQQKPLEYEEKDKQSYPYPFFYSRAEKRSQVTLSLFFHFYFISLQVT